MVSYMCSLPAHTGLQSPVMEMERGGQHAASVPGGQGPEQVRPGIAVGAFRKHLESVLNELCGQYVVIV